MQDKIEIVINYINNHCKEIVSKIDNIDITKQNTACVRVSCQEESTSSLMLGEKDGAPYLQCLLCGKQYDGMRFIRQRFKIEDINQAIKKALELLGITAKEILAKYKTGHAANATNDCHATIGNKASCTHCTSEVNFTIETAIISWILHDNSMLYNNIPNYVTAEYFCDKQCKLFFKLIKKLTADPLFVADYNTVSAILVSEESKQSLKNINDLNPPITLIDTYIKTLIVSYVKRETAECYNKAHTQIKECEAQEINNVVNSTENKILELVSQYDSRKNHFVSQECKKFFWETYMAIAKNGEKKGFLTGLQTIDNATNGFKRGDLVILAGRAGCGKTALAIQFMNYMRVSYPEEQIAFFSLEMSQEEITFRSVANLANIPVRKLKKGGLTPEEQVIIAGKLNSVPDDNYIEYYDYNLCAEQLFLRIAALKQTRGIDIIFLDHLQILKLSNKTIFQNRNLEISIITRKLKEIALSTNTTIVLLSQMSRDIEKRNDSEPKLSDLRDSGCIEQDANIVLMLTKEKRDKENETANNKDRGESLLTLHLLKNRDGCVTQVQLNFDGNKMRFCEKKEGIFFEKSEGQNEY